MTIQITKRAFLKTGAAFGLGFGGLLSAEAKTLTKDIR